MLPIIKNIKYTTTSKLLFGKFAFAVHGSPKMNRPSGGYWSWDRGYTADTKALTDYNHDLATLNSIFEQIKETNPARIVKTDWGSSIYLTTEVATRQTFDEIRKYRRLVIDQIMQPHDEAQLALMLLDHKIVCRPTLFGRDKFEWKITFKSSFYETEAREELFEWVVDMYDDDKYLLSSIHCRQPTLCLTTESDVMLAKLVHHPVIAKIEKVSLIAKQ